MIRKGGPRVNQIPGGGGANPAQGATVWNPGAAPGDGYVTTWAEVYEAFGESTGEYTVFLDDAGGGAFDIPAGTYDADARLSFERPAPATGQITVVMADGAVLQDLAGVRQNITLQTNGTATTALPLSSGRGIEFDLGAVLENLGTQPAIDIGAGDSVALNFSRRSGALATGAEIATIGAGSTLRVNVLDATRTSFGADLFTGAGTLQYRTDGSFVLPALASPPAAVSYARTDGQNVATGSVVWNPGAAAGDGYVTTWAEVMRAFEPVTGEFTVYLDDAGGGAFTVPAGTHEADSRLRLARAAPAVGQLTVSLADGAVLRNLAGVYRNVTLETNGTATTALPLDNGRGIEFDLGAVLRNQGTQPAIDIAAGDTARLGFYRGSSAQATGAEIATIGDGSTLTADISSSPSTAFSTNLWTGHANGTLDYRVDASFTAPTLASPPGTVSTTQIDNAGTTTGYLWSPLDFCVGHGSIVLSAGNFTSGIRFRPLKPLRVRGVRTYWAGAPAVTLKCQIWNPAGVSQASQNVVTSGVGIYEAVFSSPITVPLTSGTGVANWYTVSVYQTTGANYTRIANNMFAMGPMDTYQTVSFSFLWDFSTGMFVAGDGFPNGTVGNAYLIELLVD